MPELIVVDDLPIAKIIWAGSDRTGNHDNHLHVEGDPIFTGTPPLTNPGMSPSVKIIYEALKRRFGTTAYFLDAKAKDADWTHMGWYNRRKIAGSTTWSQHSWSNAIDLGPYWYVKEQQVFYDFLTGREAARIEDMFTADELKILKDLCRAVQEEKSSGYFAREAIRLVRRERDYPLHKPEKGGLVPHKHRISATVEAVTGDPL